MRFLAEVALEIESYPEADLPLAVCAGRDEKVAAGEFLGRGRFGAVVSEGGEINEFGAVIKNGRIENVIDLQDRPDAIVLAEFPFARDVHIERIKARAASGVSRQIAAAGAYRLQRKLGRERVG